MLHAAVAVPGRGGRAGLADPAGAAADPAQLQPHRREGLRRPSPNRLEPRAPRLQLRSQAPPGPDGEEGPPRRQGRQPRRDDLGARAAGAAGVHHHHRRVPRLPRRRLAGVARRRGGQGRPQGREGDGQDARRPGRPAARERALRRQVLDARDDGHRPQPRAQRRVGGGPGRPDRRRPVRLRLLPPLHLDVRPHRARPRGPRLRPAARQGQGEGRRHRRRQGVGRDAAPPLRAVQGPRREGHGQAVPAGSGRAAPRRHRGGVPELGRRPGHRLPRARAHPARPRHRGERADDGVRQPRRQQRHRRGLHPRRVHRREQALRRLPRQRPGRGRGGRHPQHRGPRRAGAEVPEDPQGAAGDLRPAREALPRHVRHGVHHRAGQALDAPDPRRQAHRRRRAPHGRGDDQAEGLEDQPDARR